MKVSELRLLKKDDLVLMVQSLEEEVATLKLDKDTIQRNNEDLILMVESLKEEVVTLKSDENITQRVTSKRRNIYGFGPRK